MTTPAKQGLAALTEKERETLRLIVRGHDAKSVARTLGLSVHTINERLREARRKMVVSSSREAARLLFEAEGSVVAARETAGDTIMGDAATGDPIDDAAVPIAGTGSRRPWLIAGVLLMLLAILIVTALPHADAPPAAVSATAAVPPVVVANPAAAAAAERFLVMIDQARWDASYAATGDAFRKANTVRLWADTSRQARAPLGAVIGRTLLGGETVAAPPSGLQLVRFRTQFANKADVAEAVTLGLEHGDWRVVGITID